MSDLFRTRDHVPDFDIYVRQFAERSAATRATLRTQLDVAYGPGPDEKLDLFFPADLKSPAPVHLFVHGGYWRMFAKSDFSFIADTVTSTNSIAAVMDYSLMPKVRMETIVSQVGLAFDWLVRHAASFGGDGGKVSVSGHSAGAHLCSLLLTEDRPLQPAGSLLLSGIYELEPLRHSFLQPEIPITEEEAERFSPLRLAFRPKGAVRILVGERETEPFHAQATDLADRAGTTVERIQDGNHMSVALDMGDQSSQVGKALIALVS
jgi:arylformamidase